MSIRSLEEQFIFAFLVRPRSGIADLTLVRVWQGKQATTFKALIYEMSKIGRLKKWIFCICYLKKSPLEAILIRFCIDLPFGWTRSARSKLITSKSNIVIMLAMPPTTVFCKVRPLRFSELGRHAKIVERLEEIFHFLSVIFYEHSKLFI